MASWNGSPSKTPPPLPVFDFLTTFIELKVVIAYAEQYASELNFITRHHPKSYFSEKAWPFSRPFPVDKYSMRGHILCSPKSNGRDVRSKCNWKLVYKFDKQRKVYMWLPEQSIMKHDHSLTPIPITLDGCKEIKHEKDLGNYLDHKLFPAVEVHYWVPTLFANYGKLNNKADYGKERLLQ